MNVLQNLLIACRRECEERRRQVADLERLDERLRADASRLLAEIEHAHAAGAEAVAGRLHERHARLQRSVDDVAERLAAARAAFAQAYQQLKRHEPVPGAGGVAIAARAVRRNRRP